eukprot:EG_transcript_16806
MALNNSTVYLQLGRRAASPKKGANVFGADGNVFVEQQPPLSTQTPYEFFYPEEGAMSPQAQDRSKSPDRADRAGVRKRRKEFLKDKDFRRFEAGSNLVIVHKAFLQTVAEDGTVTKKDFGRAMASLNVVDAALIDRIFELFDPSKEGMVEYEEVINAIDVIVNGVNKNITATDCFALVDPTGCGYVIMNWLQELKHKRAESPQVTHLMVKTLLEIFERLQREEEERRLKEKSKKGKKAKADAALPQVYAKKIHLNFEEFTGFLATDPAVVQAFLSRILITMETVYMKNKKAVSVMGDDAA